MQLLILVLVALTAVKSQAETFKLDPQRILQLMNKMMQDTQNKNMRNVHVADRLPTIDLFAAAMRYLQKDLFGKIARETYLASKSGLEPNISSICLNSLREMATGLVERRLWAIQMIDSFGRIPAGMSSITIKALGDFDLCVETIVPNKFQGRYCRVVVGVATNGEKPKSKDRFIPLDISKVYDKNVTKTFDSLLSDVVDFDLVELTTSVCLPSTCSSREVPHILSKVVNKDLLEISVAECSIKPSVNFTFGEIIIIAVISTLIMIEILATVLDLRLRESCPEKIQDSLLSTRVKWILCFSFYSNTVRLFKKDGNPDSMKIFHGIKFFTMAWTILGHSLIFACYNAGRWKYIIQIIGRFSFQIIVNTFLGVETFLFLSGFLVVYSFIKANSPNINFLQHALHRYLRLLPPIVFIIGMALLFPHFGSGPMWQDYVQEYLANNCKKSWWRNLLFINNLNEGPHRCVHWTWYLAVDMQFYIVSFFLLLIFKRKPNRAIFLLKLIVVLNIFFLAGTYTYYQLPPQPSMVYVKPDDTGLLLMLSHFRTYNHITPYSIGMIAGYVVAKKGKIHLSWGKKFLGWSASTLFAVITVFATYLWNSGNPASLVESVLYGSLYRFLWSLMLFWIVFICVIGEAGVVNSILSWEGFVPLGRLTYMSYLMHPFYMILSTAAQRYVFFGDEKIMVEIFLSNLVISYFIAFVAALICESPFLALQTLLTKGNNITREMKKGKIIV